MRSVEQKKASLGRAMCRGVRKFLLVGLPLAPLLARFRRPGAVADAAAGGIAPDLLQMFQSLSPEQQDAIMKQLGVSGGAGGILGLLGGGGSAAQSSQGAQGRRGQAATGNETENEEGGAEETTPEPTGLNGDDWVIVLADLPANKVQRSSAPAKRSRAASSRRARTRRGRTAAATRQRTRPRRLRSRASSPPPARRRRRHRRRRRICRRSNSTTACSRSST